MGPCSTVLPIIDVAHGDLLFCPTLGLHGEGEGQGGGDAAFRSGGGGGGGEHRTKGCAGVCSSACFICLLQILTALEMNANKVVSD